jgi:hypothetical protein
VVDRLDHVRPQLIAVSLRCITAVALVGAIAACDTGRAADGVAKTTVDSLGADSIARARQDSFNRAQPGYVVDSVLPVEEELRRFRAAIGGPTATALEHGSNTRDALVRRMVSAVAAQDTASLRDMALTAREFADLVYPSSPYTHPPYRQAPGLVWMQTVTPSVSGFKRLMARRGGVRFTYVGHRCKPAAEQQGKNKLWLDCMLRLVSPERDTTTQRWFGQIIERDGRFKIVSYSNQF